MTEISPKENNLSIDVVVGQKLNKGQKVLFQELVECQRESKTFTRNQLACIYSNYVERNPGQYWDYYKHKVVLEDGSTQWRGGYSPKPRYMFEANAMQWFTSALGTLIKKGYLTVIPRLDLVEGKDGDETES